LTKSFRHGQIVKLIRNRSISTQEELARALKSVGVEATQVTLSRDIRELGLVKTANGYREIEREEPLLRFAMLAGEFLQDVRIAQNQVVLRTAPGHANSVAVALDDEEWPEIVGTIAGDDTILVICPDTATAKTVHQKLIGMLE
jgi:transcriptional regulator of arginine metabolism